MSMSIGDLFWLFFMFTAIQPMLRQRMLEAMRVRKISQLEKFTSDFARSPAGDHAAARLSRRPLYRH